MEKIDSKETVYQLIKKHPKLKKIMADYGFEHILKPGMLESVGRFMTLKKGIIHKGINVDKFTTHLNKNGFDWEDNHE